MAEMFALFPLLSPSCLLLTEQLLLLPCGHDMRICGNKQESALTADRLHRMLLQLACCCNWRSRECLPHYLQVIQRVRPCVLVINTYKPNIKHDTTKKSCCLNIWSFSSLLVFSMLQPSKTPCQLHSNTATIKAFLKWLNYWFKLNTPQIIFSKLKHLVTNISN